MPFGLVAISSKIDQREAGPEAASVKRPRAVSIFQYIACSENALKDRPGPRRGYVPDLETSPRSSAARNLGYHTAAQANSLITLETA